MADGRPLLLKIPRVLVPTAIVLYCWDRSAPRANLPVPRRCWGTIGTRFAPSPAPVRLSRTLGVVKLSHADRPSADTDTARCRTTDTSNTCRPARYLYWPGRVPTAGRAAATQRAAASVPQRVTAGRLSAINVSQHGAVRQWPPPCPVGTPPADRAGSQPPDGHRAAAQVRSGQVRSGDWGCLHSALAAGDEPAGRQAYELS